MPASEKPRVSRGDGYCAYESMVLSVNWATLKGKDEKANSSLVPLGNLLQIPLIFPSF